MSAAARDLIAGDMAGIAVDEIVFPSSQVTFSNYNDFFVSFVFTTCIMIESFIFLGFFSRFQSILYQHV